MNESPPEAEKNFWSYFKCSYSRTRVLEIWNTKIIPPPPPDLLFFLIKFGKPSQLHCSRGGSRNLFWGDQTKVPNRKLRAKPESRARSARVSRAKPESRARSARVSRMKPESRARSARKLRAKPKPRAKPEKKRGEGSGEGLGEPLPRKFLKNQN